MFAKVLKNNFFSSFLHFSSVEVKQIRIPCPWGHISGVWYGRDDVQPIIGVHGWLDNCGSWLRLAKSMVNEQRSFLAIDLPGTGHSSHLPPFYNYHFSGSAAILRRLQLYFNFNDLILFGHSGGAASCFLYSALYPDLVRACLLVDYIFYSYKNHSRRADVTGEIMDEYVSLALKGKSLKKYNWEAAKEAWINGSLLGATDPDLIEDLMNRGIEEINGEYSFSRDLRLRNLKAISIDCFSVEQFKELVRSFNSHLCLIKALNSPFFELGTRNVPPLTAVDLLRKSARSFHYHELEANHHVHMKYPNEVGKIATNFLNDIK